MSRIFARGQVGLMLLVVVGLVMGLVLSIASRSLTDTVLTRQERENAAAFALAESGVEEALRALTSGGPTTGTLTDASTGLFEASYAVEDVNSFEMGVAEGESVEVDVTTLANGSTVTINWTRAGAPVENVSCSGSQGSGINPAGLAVTVIEAGGGVRRGFYDPNGCDIANNGFALASAGTGGYRSAQTVTKQAGDLVVRAVPIYNGASLRISGAGLNEAMFRVSSVGAGGDAQKAIEVKRSRDAAGSVFDYALFSGGTIIHN